MGRCVGETRVFLTWIVCADGGFNPPYTLRPVFFAPGSARTVPTGRGRYSPPLGSGAALVSVQGRLAAPGSDQPLWAIGLLVMTAKKRRSDRPGILRPKTGRSFGHACGP